MKVHEEGKSSFKEIEISNGIKDEEIQIQNIFVEKSVEIHNLEEITYLIRVENNNIFKEFV